MKFRTRLIEEIRKDAKWQEAKATGNADAFLDSEQSYVVSINFDEIRFTQYGVPYSDPIQRGRGKTANRTGGLFDALYKWVGLRKYGLSFRNDKERIGISFAIMRKMSKEGSYKFRNRINDKIYEQAIKRALPLLFDEVGQERTKQINSSVADIVNTFR